VNHPSATTTLAGELNQAHTNNVFGTFTVQSGGVYDNESGSRTAVARGTVNDLGTHVTQSGGFTTVLGQWNEQSGFTNEISGTFSIGSGGTYTTTANGFTKVKSGGTFDVQFGGTVNNFGKHVTQPGATTTLAGEMNQAKTNNVFGTYTVQAGGIYDNEAGSRTDVTGVGIFTVNSGGTVNNSADFNTNIGATTNLSGLWNEMFGNTNTIFGTFNVASGGIYDNEVNGLTKIKSGGNFNLQTGGKVNNFGKYVVQTGSTALFNDEYDNNPGSKTINFGTINQCGEVFNDLGGIFVGTPIVDICPS